jgi:hypothetical protein
MDSPSAAHLKRLMEIAPPPARPVAGRGDWAGVVKLVGLALPSDYRPLVEAYGSGIFDGFLEVLTPFSQPGGGLLDFGLRTVLEGLREVRASGVPIPFPLHPEPGGLLPWGDTANGDWCYWLTRPSEDPDRWSVAIQGSRSTDFWEHPGPLSAALADLLSGRARPPIFPPEFPSDDPRFDQGPEP